MRIFLHDTAQLYIRTFVLVGEICILLGLQCTTVFVHCAYVCVQVGKEFDALIIDTAAPHGAPVFDIFDGDTVEVRALHSVLNMTV